MTVSLARCCGALLAASLAAVASAQVVHRCTDAAGRVAYQSEPCEAGRRQATLRLPASPHPPAAAASGPRGGYVPPRVAGLVFYYDPADEPVGYSAGQMEAAIRDALQAWMNGCRVDLQYGGRRPRQLPGTPEHVPIYWEPAYLRAPHPADARSGIAATGSPVHGIALAPRFREEHMRPVLVHELGHVLGLPHNHADTQSVMSYLSDEGTRQKAQPSEADLADCNVSMKKRFGIDHTGPPGTPASAPRMTDAEALERKHGPRPASEARR